VLANCGTRVRIVAWTTKRQFIYQWRTPRSRVLKVLTVPVLLTAGLIALVVALLVISLVLAAAALVLVVNFPWLGKQSRARRRP
jgi:Flp pilus assembly protein TadB